MKYLILLLMFICPTAQSADYYKVFLQERSFAMDPKPVVIRTLFNCTLDGDDLNWDTSGNATSYSIFECEGFSNEYFDTPQFNAPNANYFATFIIDGVELYPLRFHCALVSQFYSRSDNYGERRYDCLPHPIFVNGFEKH